MLQKNWIIVDEMKTQFFPNGMEKSLKIRNFRIHQYGCRIEDQLKTNIQGVSQLSGHVLLQCFAACSLGEDKIYFTI